MRKYRLLFVILMLALILWGCSAPAEETQPPQVATAPATEAPTENPTETPTEAPTVSADLPYLQKVNYADQAIFSGPGYDYGYVSTVREAGTYTIVEEAWDEEGNLWGKLKSGSGWIDLTEVRLRLEFPEPISAGYTDELLLQNGDYHRYVGCDEEYAVSVTFQAHETLTNVRLYSMIFLETMELYEELLTLPTLDPGKPLVAELDFPGDMSTYAILFADSIGDEYCYTLYISGRNGTLVLTPYAP